MKRSSPKKSCFTVLPAVLHVFPHGAEAVSYTHLDVYKRQALYGLTEAVACIGEDADHDYIVDEDYSAVEFIECGDYSRKMCIRDSY